MSRFVAEIASASGFAGILCGSVRYPGENLIVFDPSWCPKNLGDPVSVTLDENAIRLRNDFFWNRGEAFTTSDLPIIELPP